MIAGALELQLYADVARIQQDMAKAQSIVGGAMEKINSAIGATTKLLGALGVGLSAGAFVAFVKGAIDGADALNKLSQKTGFAVENLSQLQYAAKLADVSNDGLNTAIKKLNISVAQGLAGDKEKIGLFKALGITTADLGKGTESVMLKMADAYSKAKDGAGKVAVGNGLMGKTADEMIPFLNAGGQAIRDLMKEADKLGLTISSDFASRAEEFNDNLTRFKASGEKLAIVLGDTLVKSLGLAVQKMAEATVEGGKFAGVIAFIQTFLTGDDRHKANVSMVETAERMLEIQNAMDRIKSKGANQTGQDAATVASLKKELDLLQKQYDMHRNYGKLLDDEAAKQKAIADAQKKARDEGPPIKVPNAATAGEYEAINKELQKYIDLTQAELAFGRELPESAKKEAEGLSKINDAWMQGKITLEQAVNLEEKLHNATLLRESLELRQKLVKIMQDEAEAIMQIERERADAAVSDSRDRERVARAITEQYASLRDSNEQLALEQKLIGSDDRTRSTLIANLKIEQQIRKQIDDIQRNTAFEPAQRAMEIARLQDQEQMLKKQVVERANLEEQVTLMGKIQDAGKSLWDAMWEGGSNVAQRLGKVFKTFLLDLLYEMTAKKWLISLSASATGGVAEAATSAGGSAAGSSLFGTAASAAGGGILSAMGTAYTAGSTSVGVMAGSVAGGGGVMGGVASALGAIPVYGWIALAAIALYSMFSGKGGGPKNIGAFSSDNALYSGVRSDSNAAANSAAQQSVQGILSGYASVANSLGLTAGKLDAAVLASVDSADGGTSLTALAVQAWLNGQMVYDRNNATQGGNYEDVGRTPEELQAAQEEAVSRAVLSALQKTDMPTKLAEYFDSLNPLQMSAKEIADAFTVAQSAQQVWSVFGQLGTQFQHFSDMTVEATASFLQLAGGMEAFNAQAASYVQNFYSQDEQRGMTAAGIQKSLAGVGVNFSVAQILGASREDFRHVVEYFASLGTAGEPVVAMLMKLNGAFASMTPATDSLADSLDTVVDRMGRVDGYAATYEAALARQNSNISAAAAFARQSGGIANSSLSGAVTRAQQELIAAQNLAAQTQDAHNAAVAASVKQFRDLADSLKAMREGLDVGPQGALFGDARYEATKRALGGATNENAAELVKNFLDAAKDHARNSVDYSREVALAKSVLASLENGARQQAATAAQQAGSVDGISVLLAQAKLGLAQLNQSTFGASQEVAGPMYDEFFMSLARQSGMEHDAFQQWAQTNLGVALNLPSFAVGTDSLPWDGPIYAHKGERITPAAYNRSDAENSDIVAAIARLEGRLDAIADSSDRTDRTLRDAANGTVPLMTEVAV